MRRAWRELLPAFAHLFGIKPWELEKLTYGELDAFATYLDAFLSKAES